MNQEKFSKYIPFNSTTSYQQDARYPTYTQSDYNTNYGASTDYNTSSSDYQAGTYDNRSYGAYGKFLLMHSTTKIQLIGHNEYIVI